MYYRSMMRTTKKPPITGEKMRRMTWLERRRKKTQVPVLVDQQAEVHLVPVADRALEVVPEAAVVPEVGLVLDREVVPVLGQARRRSHLRRTRRSPRRRTR